MENNKKILQKKGWKDYYQRNKDKKRKYYQDNKERIKEYQKKNKEKIMEKKRLYYRKNKEIRLVRDRTRNNYKKENKCEICKSIKNLEWHHWRYKLPLQKRDFNTLCKSCHGIQHTNNFKLK